MFGIGVTEMVIVGILFLVIFGPSKLPDMARDLGRFVSEARRSVEEFKADLASGEASGEEGDREPRKGRGPEVGRELEQNVRREEVAAGARSAPRADPE